jgi:uncharacterized membrane protein
MEFTSKELLTSLKRRPKRRYLMLLVGGIATTLAVGLTVWFLTPTGKTDFTLATTRQPEKLTELYFNGVQYLPHAVTPQQLTSFSYNVTNHEAATVTYTAVITITENGKVRTLEHDEFIVKDGDSHDATVRFSTPNAGTSLLITVSLPQVNQTIHFRSQS